MGLDVYLRVFADVGATEPYEVVLAEGHITHNLGPIWVKAGIYDILYHGEGRYASDLVKELSQALVNMQSKPNEYREIEPANGFGSYDGAVDFLANLVHACLNFPKGQLHIHK